VEGAPPVVVAKVDQVGVRLLEHRAEFGQVPQGGHVEEGAAPGEPFGVDHHMGVAAEFVEAVGIVVDTVRLAVGGGSLDIQLGLVGARGSHKEVERSSGAPPDAI